MQNGEYVQGRSGINVTGRRGSGLQPPHPRYGVGLHELHAERGVVRRRGPAGPARVRARDALPHPPAGTGAL